MNSVRIGEYCIGYIPEIHIDTIIMYTFILRLAIRMYTIYNVPQSVDTLRRRDFKKVNCR